MDQSIQALLSIGISSTIKRASIDDSLTRQWEAMLLRLSAGVRKRELSFG